MQECENKQNSRRELYNGVLPRNIFGTVFAFAAECQKAQEWNQFPGTQNMLAARAARAAPDTLVMRKAADQDVAEATQHKP